MRIKNVLKKALKYVLMPCALVCSIISIYSINANAYYLGNDGNVYSNNLFNYDTRLINTGLVWDTGETYSNNNYWTSNYIDVNQSTYYSISGNDYNGVSFYNSNHEFLGGIASAISGSSFETPLYTEFIRIASTNSVTQVMLNQGSSALAYEPYGKWWNEADYENQKYIASIGSIASLFNGALVEVEASDQSFRASAEIDLPDDATSLNYYNLPYSIQQYILEEPANGLSFSITLNYAHIGGGSNANLYFTSPSATHTITMDSVTAVDATGPYPINSNYSQYFNLSENQTSFLINPTFTWKRLYIDNLDSNNFNFNISLSYDNYFYKDGYNVGYENGKTAGYEIGRIDGYNNGYNEGSQSNLETQGMKTLFNSILSFPVNMIKEVFNFNFMGINVASVIMFVVSIGIVIFVVRRFKE